MSQEKTFRINLPTLFERVNERRREQGLPSVEPAIMAVRASIKFAIRRQKHMDLKDERGELEMDEGDADALCQTLGELFNVDLHFDEPETAEAEAPPSEPAASLAPPPEAAEGGEQLVLPLFQFYGSINRERRTKGLQPIEPAVISVRTGIKFSIMQRRTLNFRDNALVLSEADLRALDGIVAQQFDAEIPGGLRSLCHAPAPESPATTEPAAAATKGFLGRLFGRRGGKAAQPESHPTLQHKIHYSLDTSNLLLAIITRRAYLGHKPITPDKVKRRCGKALSVELELDMDEERIALTPEQIDAFAEVIRKEFEIMFEDLDDLLGKKQNK